MKPLTAVMVLLIVSAGARAADPPSLRFDPDEVVLNGAAPGKKISWIGMVREFVRATPQLRIVRGLEPPTGRGELSLGKGFDPSCSVWAIGGVDEPMTVIRAGERCGLSPEPIKVTAQAGAGQFTVHSSVVYGHYIARRNSAWRFALRDGSDLDADGKVNGQIVVALNVMGKLKGSPHPPQTMAAGDTLLLLDSESMRAAAIEVQP